MTVVLVGAPGAGKTTVGRLLAQQFECAFVDVDARIEAETGRLIREIFAADGEPAFRALEHDATLRSLAEGGVVALGGGAVMTPGIREALAAHTVIWLRVSVLKATRRVGLTGVRPLLLGDVRARMQALLDQRSPVYRDVATHIVDTDRLTPAEVAEEILTRMGEA